MKFVLSAEQDAFLLVPDEEDERDLARISSMIRGIMFRQAEVRYDGLPRWKCRDCGRRVFAGHEEAVRYPTAFVSLYLVQRCMPCVTASMNSVLARESAE